MISFSVHLWPFLYNFTIRCYSLLTLPCYYMAVTENRFGRWNFIALGLIGCIYTFKKWQIHPFKPRGEEMLFRPPTADFRDVFFLFLITENAQRIKHCQSPTPCHARPHGRLTTVTRSKVISRPTGAATVTWSEVISRATGPARPATDLGLQDPETHQWHITHCSG